MQQATYLLLLLVLGVSTANYIFHRCCYFCSRKDEKINKVYPDSCYQVTNITNRYCEKDNKTLCYEFHKVNVSNGQIVKGHTERGFAVPSRNICAELIKQYGATLAACNYCNSDLCNDQYPATNFSSAHVDGLYDDIYPTNIVTPPSLGCGRESNWWTLLSVLVISSMLARRVF